MAKEWGQLTRSCLQGSHYPENLTCLVAKEWGQVQCYNGWCSYTAVPGSVRSDNGPELMAQPLLTFFKDQGIIPRRIAPGKPWQNGSNEKLNGTFRRECLDAERFHSLVEARVVIEAWRQHYYQERPYSALGYHTPATAYWGAASRRAGSEPFSDIAPEKSTHTVGCESPIIDRPDSRGLGRNALREEE